jgi:peptidylprolyl isomerase
MKTAEIGCLVKIHYIISIANGNEIGQQKTSGPLSFKIGAGKVLQKLEEGVIGMRVGEKRRIAISAAAGYGEYKKDRVLRLERKIFPEDIKLIPGRTVQYQDRDGERVNFIVNEVTEKTVTVDSNHPLAGLDLVYDVELVEVS